MTDTILTRVVLLTRRVAQDTKAINERISGARHDLAALETASKGSLVDAVNEVNAKAGDALEQAQAPTVTHWATKDW